VGSTEVACATVRSNGLRKECLRSFKHADMWILDTFYVFLEKKISSVDEKFMTVRTL
jgi:hypothetical protein